MRSDQLKQVINLMTDQIKKWKSENPVLPVDSPTTLARAMKCMDWINESFAKIQHNHETLAKPLQIALDEIHS
jgi:hypothetical protein